jgi:hypothetical protein
LACRRAGAAGTAKAKRRRVVGVMVRLAGAGLTHPKG